VFIVPPESTLIQAPLKPLSAGNQKPIMPPSDPTLEAATGSKALTSTSIFASSRVFGQHSLFREAREPTLSPG